MVKNIICLCNVGMMNMSIKTSFHCLFLLRTALLTLSSRMKKNSTPKLYMTQAAPETHVSRRQCKWKSTGNAATTHTQCSQCETGLILQHHNTWVQSCLSIKTLWCIINAVWIFINVFIILDLSEVLRHLLWHVYDIAMSVLWQPVQVKQCDIW